MKKTEATKEPEMLEKVNVVVKPPLLLKIFQPRLTVERLPVREIMSRVHLRLMLETFLVSKQPLKLEFKLSQRSGVVTVMTRDQLPEVEVDKEEEEETEAEADKETETLKLPDLMLKETLTLMIPDQREEEMLEEVESMRDLIEKTAQEEPTEVEEKEKIEVQSVVMNHWMPLSKKKKFKPLKNQRLYMKLSDNLSMISLKLELLLVLKKLEKLKKSKINKLRLLVILQK